MPITITPDKDTPYAPGDFIQVAVNASPVASTSQVTYRVSASRTVNGVEETAELEIPVEYPVEATPVVFDSGNLALEPNFYEPWKHQGNIPLEPPVA